MFLFYSSSLLGRLPIRLWSPGAQFWSVSPKVTAAPQPAAGTERWKKKKKNVSVFLLLFYFSCYYSIILAITLLYLRKIVFTINYLAWNCMSYSSKVKHKIITQPSDFTPGYIPKRFEIRYWNKYTHMRVHSIIHGSQKIFFFNGHQQING